MNNKSQLIMGIRAAERSMGQVPTSIASLRRENSATLRQFLAQLRIAKVIHQLGGVS